MPAGTGPVRVAGVAITHPDRLVWPDEGITKADLARYYERVGKWLRPHLVRRPLSLVRCPGGVAAHCFFQKHPGPDRPESVRTFVWRRSRDGERYFYAAATAAAIQLVQRGAVELHTWGATLPRVARPDRMTIDLDPDPDLPWARVVEAARLTRALLEMVGLAGFLKTTGGKGLHIVVPLERRHSWPEVKAFARAIAERLALTMPDRFTASVAKRRRTGRIFIDYLRNTEGATAVAAYSARARPGAPVSTPIRWDELAADVRESYFNVKNVPVRLARSRKDPWAGYARQAQRLTPPMRRALGVEEP